MSARQVVVVAIAFGVLAAAFDADAQAPTKLPRIGVLRMSFRDGPDPALDGLRQGLRELGYVEGQNVDLTYRWADGSLDRVPALAAELVRLNVDVIVAGGEQAILAVKRATSTIPVVMGASNDPVGSGLVASLARPGGNVTGMTALAPELSRKRLELLKEVLPRVPRVAVLYNPAYPGTARDLAETRNAARQVGLTLQDVEVRAPADLEAALTSARERANALILLGDPFFSAHRPLIVDFTMKHRLPGMYYWKEFVESGGLISYGPSLPDLYRRAARHVDKILKGMRPADLPVEQPTKFELAINLKTAKAFGVTFPQTILVRADLVIQ